MRLRGLEGSADLWFVRLSRVFGRELDVVGGMTQRLSYRFAVADCSTVLASDASISGWTGDSPWQGRTPAIVRLAAGVDPLHLAEQIVDTMLDGCRNQQFPGDLARVVGLEPGANPVSGSGLASLDQVEGVAASVRSRHRGSPFRV